MTLENTYLLNQKPNLSFFREKEIPFDAIKRAIFRFDHTMEIFSKFEFDVFSILGLRNLSAFVGEVFSAMLAKESKNLFVSNPHQDGYPDLLFLDPVGKELLDSLKDRMQEKAPFSPFQSGGLEIKATCGSVPTPVQCQRLGKTKPIIGEQRIELLRGYDWKAHHQETNHLLGLVWDFVEGKPKITGIFYSPDLDNTSGSENEDWGAIIQPREGGGRTTSVSIMKRAGVKKMYESWLVVYKDERYTRFFDKYNKGELITPHLP